MFFYNLGVMLKCDCEHHKASDLKDKQIAKAREWKSVFFLFNRKHYMEEGALSSLW